MATTVASLRILLGLDSKDVRDGAGSVKSELKGIQGEANKTQGALSDIKKGIGQGLGVGIGIGGVQAASAAVQQLTGFLNDAVKAAQGDEQSVAQLNAALKANVPAWTGASDAIDKQIAASQRLGFTDDEVRGSLARLSAVTHDVNESLKIQQAAMDLARFKNIDLGTATQALVQVEAGRYRGLAALGINIKDIHNRTEALAAVQKVAAGSAEAWGKTSAGAAQEAGIAFDEAQEAIGKRLLPVVTEFSHAMRDVVAPAITVVADNLNTLQPVVTGLAVILTTQFAVGLGQSALAAVGLGTALVPLPASVLEAGAAMTIAGTAAEGLAVGVNTANVAVKGLLGPLALLAAIATQGIFKDDKNKIINDFNDSIGRGGKASTITAGEMRGATAAADGLTSSVDEATSSIVGFGVVTTSAGLTILAARQATDDAASSFVEFGAASIDSAAGLTIFAANLGTTADDAAAAEGQVTALQRAIAGLPSEVAIRIKVIAEGAGGRNVEESVGTKRDIATGAGDPTIAQANADFLRDQAARDAQYAADRKRARDKAAADAKAAADKAAADAKRAAAEAKRVEDEANRARVAAANDMFDRMADAAHKYFDDLHKANLKAIDDDQKRADAAIENQKKLNLEPATAAEARLRAVQQARQLAGLQADLAAAKTPEERLRAQQALSDFQAQARIDFLRKQGEDANAILDETKKQQDQGYDDQRTAENKRNQDQVNLFDENLKSLREYVAKHPKEWKKSTDSVMALLKAAGVDYKKAGKDNADAYIAGVRSAFGGAGAPGDTGTGGKGSTPKFALPGTRGAMSGTSPAVVASAGLIPVGGGVKGDVYLDGNKVGEFIERYLAANASASTSGYTARTN